MVRQQADFFEQLAVHRRFGAFAGLDAALGKLPRLLAQALAPEHFIVLVGQNDADVRPVTFSVQHGCLSRDGVKKGGDFPINRARDKAAGASIQAKPAASDSAIGKAA